MHGTARENGARRRHVSRAQIARLDGPPNFDAPRKTIEVHPTVSGEVAHRLAPERRPYSDRLHEVDGAESERAPSTPEALGAVPHGPRGTSGNRSRLV